jgi:hypothetical protein
MKILFLLFFGILAINCSATDTYNAQNRQLLIPTVKVDVNLYSNVVITVGDVLSVGNAPASSSYDSFNSNNNQLTIPSVTVGTSTYYNVTVTVASVLSVGTTVPIPVLKSSYENKISAGRFLGPQEKMGNDATTFADFLQNGSYTLVTMTLEYDNKKPIEQAQTGHIYFYQKLNGKGWTDITNKLLQDTTGCIHPRKAMVADLNNDKKPDVVFACHGYDSPPYPGEHQRILLSQNDGTYKNVMLPTIAYAHGGSVADLDGNGYSSIIYTDTSVRREPFVLVNNKDGTFTENSSSLPQSLKKFNCFDIICSLGIYSIEFINYKSIDKFDLWTGGFYDPSDLSSITPTIYRNNGNNTFSESQKLLIKPTTFPIVTLDIVMDGSNFYTLYETGSYEGVGIDKFNLSTGTSQLFYSHTGKYSNNNSWFPWLAIFNNCVVAMNASFPVSIPLN